jgi:hypothetical protein
MRKHTYLEDGMLKAKEENGLIRVRANREGSAT